MKVLIIGAGGTLGAAIMAELVRQKPNIEVLTPNSDEMDIVYFHKVLDFFENNKPDIVVNAAAIIDNREIELDATSAIAVNVIGAANVALACGHFSSRYVYISTDYIYKGDRGNYKETDEILPFNLYAWTKLGGECSARAVKNHLIIRTSFGKNDFQYKEAFTDKWSSKDYVDRIAPLILEAATSSLVGVLNLGTERKTLFAHASERNDAVKPVKLAETTFNTPPDTSMNLQKWIDYKASAAICRPHTKCRACGSDLLAKYLDLGVMPLANNLENTAAAARAVERFPLQVMYCRECALSQLSVVINPQKMFSYYTYRSSVNKGYLDHCRNMAEYLLNMGFMQEDMFVVDIAGNDGALLQTFRSGFEYFEVLNIDPAKNLCAIAEAKGIRSIAEFWSLDLAKRLANVKKADVITATNVFAHVDNIREFLDAAHILLSKEGVLVLEFPYAVDFIKKNEFDTVYFEHLSYIAIAPLLELCHQTNMRIIGVSKHAIHGGTVRVILCKESAGHEADGSVSKFCADEIEHQGMDEFATYASFASKAAEVTKDFANQLIGLRKSGARIAAFAASAKGNTLLNAAGITTDIIEYIVDETPEKIGKFSPGTGIPIVHKQMLEQRPPDYLVILSWNFKDEIIAKVQKTYKGKFIIPIPKFEVL